MNWDALGAIAESFGSALVLVTLVYLSYQLRQNTKAIRSQAADSAMATYQANMTFIAQTKENSNTTAVGSTHWWNSEPRRLHGDWSRNTVAFAVPNRKTNGESRFQFAVGATSMWNQPRRSPSWKPVARSAG